MTNQYAPPAPCEAERPAAYADRIGGWYTSQNTAEYKKQFGQYLTPLATAYYMAGLYRPTESDTLRILDPGAGSGTLSCAACEVLASSSLGPREIHIEAYETDTHLADCLNICFAYTKDWLCGHGVTLTFTIHTEDFVLANAEVLEPALRLIPSERKLRQGFDLVISNPPYFKIPKSDARARAAATIVHGQPNIYALFMAISALLLKLDGKIICITPRSYAAGLYFRLFRERFFAIMRPEIVHLFESRQDAFSRDEILQENVILLALRSDGWYARLNGETVEISTSAGIRDLHLRDTRTVPIHEVIDLTSKDKVLRIPASDAHDRVLKTVQSWSGNLHAYGLSVSTGPIVAFRAAAFLAPIGSIPATHAPLLWMQNVLPMHIKWPTPIRTKAQYVVVNRDSMSLLLANKNYVVIRRFSAKEECRRLIAAPFLSRTVDCRYIGLENHLNYIYRPGGSLSDEETYGLAALFNSALLDTYFRTSNGNTQISATELRAIPLPSREVIEHIGRQLMSAHDLGDGADRLNALDRIIHEALDTSYARDVVDTFNG